MRSLWPRPYHGKPNTQRSMMLRRRSYEKELLDGNDIPAADIYRNMQELNTVNKLLGGHRITCKGVQQFIGKAPTNHTLTIAEIGCGGGDNLFAVHQYLQRYHIPHELVGIDINADCVSYAAQQYPQLHASWIQSDYNTILWPDGKKPDIIFSSLFCHHFTDSELVGQLKWMQANSSMGFFINDLQRHTAAYYAIKILTRLFSKSYLVKNDAPLSVKRGFKKSEWTDLLQIANIPTYTIHNEWAFRHLIWVVNEQK